MGMNSAVFVTAGPNPRMRFKRVQCPMVNVAPGVDPSVVFQAMAADEQLWQFGPRCEEEIMVFFKHVAICPVHGIVPTIEPWTEGNGGKS